MVNSIEQMLLSNISNSMDCDCDCDWDWDWMKQVKLAAAKCEREWDGAGAHPGLEIWRVEKFQIKKWPKDQYGSFYNGDSYIILKTYRKRMHCCFINPPLLRCCFIDLSLIHHCLIVISIVLIERHCDHHSQPQQPMKTSCITMSTFGLEPTPLKMRLELLPIRLLVSALISFQS